MKGLTFILTFIVNFAFGQIFEITTFVVSDGITFTEFERNAKIKLDYNPYTGTFEKFHNICIDGESIECFSYSVELFTEHINKNKHIYTTEDGDEMTILIKSSEEIIVSFYQINGIYHVFELKKGIQKI